MRDAGLRSATDSPLRERRRSDPLYRRIEKIGIVIRSAIGGGSPPPSTSPPPPAVAILNEAALIDAAGRDFAEKRIIEVYEQISPAVVNVTTQVLRRGFFFEIIPEAGPMMLMRRR